MLRAYKYRIYPTNSQIEYIEHNIGCCRLVYNIALEVKISAFKANKTRLSSIDLCKQLVEMKSEYAWMRKADSQSLITSIRNVDTAFNSYFKGVSHYPKFKKKINKQSFQCQNGVRRIDFDKGLLTLPKIKNISIAISRRFIGTIKTVTISRYSSGKYFSTILVDTNTVIPDKKNILENTAIGIDLGIKHFAVFSDGNKIINNKYLSTNEHRITCLQRRLSSKKFGGKNWNKARVKLALKYEKVYNQKCDFLHKLSSAITKQYDTVCIEDLNVSGMIKNKRLAKVVLDVGWSEFIRQIKYKCEWSGQNVLQMPMFEPSTKICNKCGIKNETLTLKDREWTCANCGEFHDRDINAAINIKKYFFDSPMGSRGEPVELSALAGAKKQEFIFK